MAYLKQYSFRTRSRILRGDPGLKSFFKKAVKAVAPIAGAGLSFLPGGGLIGKAAKVLGGPLAKRILGTSGKVLGATGTAITLGGAARAAFGPSLPGIGSGGMMLAPGSGMSISRSGSGAERSYGFGGRRTMNVGNAKALRRAIRRVEGFEKLAKKVYTFTHGHSSATKLKRGRKR